MPQLFNDGINLNYIFVIVSEKSKSDWKETRKRSTRKYHAYPLKHQREDHIPQFKNNEGDFSCKIECTNDETLEIKEENIEGKTLYVFVINTFKILSGGRLKRNFLLMF